MEEEDDVDINIDQISKGGDLLSRYTNSLKTGTKKGKPTIPV